LFHAISPSPTKDGYLVWYLPQYRAPALVAMAYLHNWPTAIPAGPTSPPITSKDSSIPPPGKSSRVISATEAGIQWIWSQFNMPCPFSCLPKSNGSTHPMTISPTPSPATTKKILACRIDIKVPGYCLG